MMLKTRMKHRKRVMAKRRLIAKCMARLQGRLRKPV